MLTSHFLFLLLVEDVENVAVLLASLLHHVWNARPNVLNAQLVVQRGHFPVSVGLHEELGLAVLADEDRVCDQACAAFDLARGRYELLNQLAEGTGFSRARVECPFLLARSCAASVGLRHLEFANFTPAREVDASLELDDLLTCEKRRRCEVALHLGPKRADLTLHLELGLDLLRQLRCSNVSRHG